MDPMVLTEPSFDQLIICGGLLQLVYFVMCLCVI